MAAGFTVTDDKGDVPAAAEFLMTNDCRVGSASTVVNLKRRDGRQSGSKDKQDTNLTTSQKGRKEVQVVQRCEMRWQSRARIMIRELQENFHPLLQTVHVTNVCGCKSVRGATRRPRTRGTVIGSSALRVCVEFAPSGNGIFSSRSICI